MLLIWVGMKTDAVYLASGYRIKCGMTFEMSTES